MSYTRDFALVTEGFSDQVVIAELLYSFFENGDLLIKGEQPNEDETDRDGGPPPAGWGNLKNHCSDPDFMAHFSTTRFVVIQIDTDKSDEYGVSHRGPEGEISLENLVENVRAKIIEWIGQAKYEKVADRIVFAVAVNEIECWLLPIYYSNNKAEKKAGCFNTLNEALKKQEKFYLNQKSSEYYEQIMKGYGKRKDLLKLGPKNPSLAIFLQELDSLAPLSLPADE
jgi:hypothetical protein